MSKQSEELKDIKITLDIKCSTVYNNLTNQEIKLLKDKINNSDFLEDIIQDIKTSLRVEDIDKMKFSIKTVKSK